MSVFERRGESEAFARRAGIFSLLVLFLAAGLGWRWAHLQVSQFSRFARAAESNLLKVLPLEPARGLIYDRAGAVLAENVTGFSLRVESDFADEVMPRLDELRQVVDVSPRAAARLQKAAKSSVYRGAIALTGLLDESQVAAFLDRQYRFPQVVLQAQFARRYPHGDFASHILGYVGRVTEEDKQRLKKEGRARAYAGAQFIGKTGLESVYEKRLRGALGTQEARVDAHGRILASRTRRASVRGRDLHLVLDADLQARAESLLVGEAGAIVVLDPQNGDVLALASSPRFDLNPFVFGISESDWSALIETPGKPLIHRAIYGQYAPGSTIKPFFALAAIDRGWREPDYEYDSRGEFALGRSAVFHDWKAGGHGRTDFVKSIVRSVNTFYYELANDVGVVELASALTQFGFGNPTGIDLDNEKGGVAPTPGMEAARVGRGLVSGRHGRGRSGARVFASHAVAVGGGDGGHRRRARSAAAAVARRRNRNAPDAARPRRLGDGARRARQSHAARRHGGAGRARRAVFDCGQNRHRASVEVALDRIRTARQKRGTAQAFARSRVVCGLRAGRRSANRRRRAGRKRRQRRAASGAPRARDDGRGVDRRRAAIAAASRRRRELKCAGRSTTGFCF